jgi:cytochrome b pre-mRNA-processing protein 3
VLRRLLRSVGLVRERPAEAAGAQLYAAAAAQARQPGFYLAGVPDTPTGRFELYTLHVVLVLHRLKGQGEEAAEVSQALFDAYIANLDLALRELGVGDLSVGKKMRKLGEAFYGRTKAYDAALNQLPEVEPLRDLIARTMLADVEGGPAHAVAAYVSRAAEGLAGLSLAQVIDASLVWPETAP